MYENEHLSNLERTKSIEDLRKLKVDELKVILKHFGEPTGGKKEDLVLRCFVLVERSSEPKRSNISDAKTEPTRPATKDFTYEEIIKEATGCVWKKDLRELPLFTFVQLYDYLVMKTSKYNELDRSATGYKKLKAFQFFKEGHLKDLQLCHKDRCVYVKAEVLASMKSVKYKAVLVFDRNTNNVVRAACKCPAGRGDNGFGRCNHIGGIIFAIEDFSRCGLREQDKPVSCTSRLCGWNVPRNIHVEPKPVDQIIFQKIRYGKKTASTAKITSYDPRAPADRCLNPQSLSTLQEKLSSCLQSSSFFLFHNIQPSDQSNSLNTDIHIDSTFESIPEDVIDANELTSYFEEMPFSDDYDISSKAFKEMIDSYVEGQTITDEEVKKIEKDTRGQNENDKWKRLKETFLTASNFKKAIIRRKEPDMLLKEIMYISNKNQRTVPSLDYGLRHEQDAVDCYVAMHRAAGNNLKVTEVGTMVSKKIPGIGASLDRLVYDPSASSAKEGGLEVKCPYSKGGMTVQEACSDSKFYLTLLNNKPVLKRGHTYFYQVQGQMYVSNLQWVDFLVWFGSDVIAVERIMFDKKWWSEQAMPALLYFYKRAFLPEVFTRRVKRGIPLYQNGGWNSFRQCKKFRSP